MVSLASPLKLSDVIRSWWFRNPKPPPGMYGNGCVQKNHVKNMGRFTYLPYQLVFLAGFLGLPSTVVRILCTNSLRFACLSVCVLKPPALVPKNKTWARSVRKPFVWVLVGKFHQRVRRRSEGLKPTAGGLKFQHFFWFMLLLPSWKLTWHWKITIFNGKYIFIHGGFSNVMLVFRGVWGIFS